MLITPSGICKGFLTPDMIIRQRFDGTIIEGSLKSTREAGMHSRLYELRPDIGAVVHTHPAAATAFAVCGRKFPENWLLEVPALIGKIGIAGFAPAGSAELVAEVEKVADSDVIFLQNHGVITYGPDIYEAFSRMDAGGEYSQDNPVFADPGGCEGILKRVSFIHPHSSVFRSVQMLISVTAFRCRESISEQNYPKYRTTLFPQ